MNDMKNDTIRFRTTPLKGPLAKDKNLYQAQPLGDGTKDIDQTADDLVELGCNVDSTTIAYVLQFFAANLPGLIARNGARRSLGGLVTFFPAITGTLKDPDAELDPARNAVEIRASVSRAFRHALEGIRACNVTSPDVRPRLLGLFDTATNAVGEAFIGKRARLVGTAILLVPGREDEGLWLEGGGLAAPLPLEIIDTRTGSLAFRIPSGASVAPGAYTLRLATRAGRAPSEHLFEVTRPAQVED